VTRNREILPFGILFEGPFDVLDKVTHKGHNLGYSLPKHFFYFFTLKAFLKHGLFKYFKVSIVI